MLLNVAPKQKQKLIKYSEWLKDVKHQKFLLARSGNVMAEKVPRTRHPHQFPTSFQSLNPPSPPQISFKSKITFEITLRNGTENSLLR